MTIITDDVDLKGIESALRNIYAALDKKNNMENAVIKVLITMNNNNITRAKALEEVFKAMNESIEKLCTILAPMAQEVAEINIALQEKEKEN